MSRILEELQRDAVDNADANPTKVETVNPENTESTDTPKDDNAPEEDPKDQAPEENKNEDPASAGPDTEKSEGSEETPLPKEKKSFVSEKAAKFNDFVRRTGKEDFKEFEFWQKPTADLDENELILKFLSEKEGMSEKEIAYEIKKLTIPEKGTDEFGDDFGDDGDYSEQEIARERALRNAKAWHEGEFQKLSSEDSESPASFDNRYTAEEYEKTLIENHNKLYQSNVQKVYEALPTISGIDIKIDGNDKLGIAPLEVVYTPDEQSSVELRTASENADNLVEKYFRNGELVDPKGWINFVAKVALNEKMIQYAIEQAVINDRAAQDKRKRNVTSDNYQSPSSGSSTDEEDFENWRKSRN